MALGSASLLASAILIVLALSGRALVLSSSTTTTTGTITETLNGVATTITNEPMTVGRGSVLPTSTFWVLAGLFMLVGFVTLAVARYRTTAKTIIRQWSRTAFPRSNLIY